MVEDGGGLRALHGLECRLGLGALHALADAWYRGGQQDPVQRWAGSPILPENPRCELFMGAFMPVRSMGRAALEEVEPMKEASLGANILVDAIVDIRLGQQNDERLF